MSNDPANIAIVLLAAGSSTRLQRPKQLVEMEGQPLIGKMAGVALGTGCQPVVIVLGAHFDKMVPAVKKLPAVVLHNKFWDKGMGESLACGVNFIVEEYPGIQAILVMLCDQPFVSSEILIQLVTKWQETKKGIVASGYGGTYGPPAVFDRRHFAGLSSLKGDKGAKSLMRKYEDQLVLVSFPDGQIDLDTEADVKKWIG